MEKKFDSERKSYFNREDSGAKKETNKTYSRDERERSSSPFARDKRPRIKRAENTPATDRNDRTERPAHPFQSDRPAPYEGKRKSFNPNFDKDNHRKDNQRNSPFEKRSDDSRSNTPASTERSAPRTGGYNKDRSNSYSKDKPSFGKDRNNSFSKDRNNSYGKDKNSRFGSEKRSFGKKKFDAKSNTPAGGFDSEYKPESYPTFEAAPINEPLRLNKYISMSGLCSRREADEFIKNGLVSVNGTVITELGVKINPTDDVTYNGESLQGEKKVYILMNKPKGFVTTVEDPNAERTVMDIVKNACKERVYPVGRLDKNSLGVLLITNDGEMTKKLTHPSFHKKKVYQVSLDKSVPLADLEKMCDGIELEDGTAIADEMSYVDASKKEIGVTIHSGRNRVVRRMFESLDYRVLKLDRVYFAGLTKKGLRRGAWRYLTTQEVSMLKSGKYE